MAIARQKEDAALSKKGNLYPATAKDRSLRVLSEESQKSGDFLQETLLIYIIIFYLLLYPEGQSVILTYNEVSTENWNTVMHHSMQS